MSMDKLQYPAMVRRWDVFELTVCGPKEGNPFAEQSVHAAFCGAGETVRVTGFYDGEGVYRVRFMPAFEGAYTFELESSFGVHETGTFTVTAAGEGNHGMVRVAGTYHGADDDGTPYHSNGTRCDGRA